MTDKLILELKKFYFQIFFKMSYGFLMALATPGARKGLIEAIEAANLIVELAHIARDWGLRPQTPPEIQKSRNQFKHGES